MTDVLRSVQGGGERKVFEAFFEAFFEEARRIAKTHMSDALKRAVGPTAIAQAAEIIDRSHALGHIHRDLKPENIIVRPDGRVYIVDFGMGLREETQFSDGALVAGTLQYMAPELLLGFTPKLDGRTDVWSLGAILSELLTGQPLIEADSKEEAFVASILACEEDAAPAGKIDPELERIASRCTSREPSKRFDTAKHLADALREWLGRKQEGKKPEGNRSRLLAWRLGVKLASVIPMHKVYHELVQACPANQEKGEEAAEDDRAAVQNAVGYAYGCLVALDEASNLLDEVGVNLPPLPEEKKYRLLFYRGKRAASELGAGEIQGDEVKIRSRMEGVLQQLTDRFAAAGGDCLALFQLGLRAKLSVGVDFDIVDFRRLATEAGLPEGTWRDVMDTLANEGDYDRACREMDRLDKRVERYLLYGDGDESVVPRSDADRGNGQPTAFQ